MVGDRIRFQFQYRRFVHERCATNNISSASYSPHPNPYPPQEFTPVEDPLAPGSVIDELTPDYRAEAVRWMQFHSGHHLIPGIHAPFCTRGLEKYLSHRSETNKDMNGILCKLKKLGMKCGFVLCTSRFQQPSLQYQELQSVKADLSKARREAGRDAEVNEALATGNFSLTLLLSAFDTRSLRRFGILHIIHKEFVAIHVMLHAGCMRFGIFRFTDILRKDLVFASQDNAYVLTTTWRKNRKSNRPYTIRFYCKPESGNPSRYALPGQRGPTYVTAGKILTWYLQSTRLMNAPGDSLLFPDLSLAHSSNRRGKFALWLKTIYSIILPPGSDIPRRIRPHSSRAGWATDRAKQNISTHSIKLEGRWSDPQAMTKYIRTSVRDLSTSARYNPIPDSMKTRPPLRLTR